MLQVLLHGTIVIDDSHRDRRRHSASHHRGHPTAQMMALMMRVEANTNAHHLPVEHRCCHAAEVRSVEQKSLTAFPGVSLPCFRHPSYSRSVRRFRRSKVHGQIHPADP
jgi:hypothetical protein